MFGVQFYPTPKEVLGYISLHFNIDWNMIRSVLEPSAGKGDIADFISQKIYHASYSRNIDTSKFIDCIEIDSNLRNVLKGKGYNVVFDDFLTFNTFKHYDLCIMNPPFQNGAAHLLKAIDLMKNGGEIICILNAETIRNPYTKERTVLANALDALEDVKIEYLQSAFSTAEHSTDVEIAIVHVVIPAVEQKSVFLGDMKKKFYAEAKTNFNTSDLTTLDYIANAVLSYNIEVASGIELIKEYVALEKQMYNTINPMQSHNHKIMNLVGEKHSQYDSSRIGVNDYIESVRRKYWEALFKNPRFTNGMTSELLNQYRNKVDELIHYDFNEYNIREIQISMSKNLLSGIEECIIALFDELSHKYHYYDETSNNIHYYNGWKTNKSWIINKKVIIPLNAFSRYFDRSLDYNYEVVEKIKDIEKALNYLNGVVTDGVDRDIPQIFKEAREVNQTKKLQFRYFTLSFFKKGTCWIEFTDLELLKKFNIFGSQKKGWLPPDYGKKKYSEMDAESQAVISEFEGKEEYNKVFAQKDYYLTDIGATLPLLEVV